MSTHQPPKPPKKKGRGCLVAAIVIAVLLLVGAISQCSGGGDQASTPASPPAPSPQPGQPAPATPASSQAAATPEQIEAYMAGAFSGKTSYLEACTAGTKWLCDVDSVKVVGDSVQANYRKFDRPGDDIARNWFNGLNQEGSPIPKVLRIDVIAADGKRGSFTRPM